MPWRSKDVDKFKKGLDDKQKKKWVAIANSALRECLSKGGDVLDCEVMAVRVANSSFDNSKVLSMSDSPNPLNPSQHTDGEEIHMALIEASDDEDEYQLAFPIGLYKTGKYGEVIVTKTFVDIMVANWKDKVLGERQVFMDTQHDFAEANAWAGDIISSDEGLEIKWEFTDKGKELILSKKYKYYSAAIGWGVDNDTGDEAFPVLIAVSLTNMPVMNTMPAAHLDTAAGIESGDLHQIGNTTIDSFTGAQIRINPTHSDGDEDDGGSIMNLTELLAKLREVLATEMPTKEQVTAVAELFNLSQAGDVVLLEARVTNLTEQLDTVVSENSELSKELATIHKEQLAVRRTAVIEKALADGKILPKNKEKWEAMFDKDPDGVESLLNEKGAEVNLGEGTGTGTGGDEGNTSVDRGGLAAFQMLHPEMDEATALAEYEKNNPDKNGGAK
tara:strand:+ start:1152 stop:2486 length:1335 start_codon:yes stop_codon:yes gene_type:complete